MKDSKEELIFQIQKSINPPHSEFLIRSIKESITLKTSQSKISNKTNSKIGGVPNLKRNSSWFRNRETGIPFLFLMQIDLSEITNKNNRIANLPQEGILTFYLDSESFSDGKVIYYKSTDNLEVADIPLEFIEEEERRNLPFWRKIFKKSYALKIFEECNLEFYQTFSIPCWDSIQIKLFNSIEKIDDKNIIVSEEFIDSHIDEKNVHHQLMGYYCGLQESIYELSFKDEINRTKNRSEIKINDLEIANEWILLAQIDSDKLAHMNWLDGGKVLYFIKEIDLINYNFKNVKVIVDST